MMNKKKSGLLYVLLVVLCGSSTLFAQSKEQISDKQQRLFKYYFYKAVTAKSTENYGAAFDLLTYCHQLNPTDANVNFELGNFYASLQDKDRSMAFYHKAMEYDAHNYNYSSTYANACFDQKRYSDAIPIYKRLIQENPTKYDLYMYLSETYRASNNLPNAIKTLNQLEKFVGLNEKISLQKFRLYSAMDQKTKAYAEIQKYIDKYPTEIKYYILMGNLYVQDTKMANAYTKFTQAKAIDSTNVYLLTSLANFYQQLGDKESAKKELRTLLFSPNADIDTKMILLGDYVSQLQQNKKATYVVNGLIDSLIVRYPQEPRLNLMYGDLLLLQNSKDSARYQFRIYSEANPSDPHGWEQLLKTTFPDSIAASNEICQKAISSLPTNPIFYFYLGNGQYLANDTKAALKTLNKGVGFASNNVYLQSQFYGQMGDIYYQNGQSDSAFDAYNKALICYPQNEPVLNNYSYYLSLKKKDLDKAEKMSSLIVKAEPTNPIYLDTYGWVLFQEGSYTVAKIYLQKAMEYGSDSTNTDSQNQISSEMFEHYGDVLFLTGEKDKALTYWIKAKDKAESTKAGSTSKILKKKIETKTYIPNEE